MKKESFSTEIANTNIFRRLITSINIEKRIINGSYIHGHESNIRINNLSVNFQVRRPLNQMYRREETSPYHNERET